MTVASTTNRVDYTGNGAVDTYAFTYRIFANTDLRVTVRDTSDVETILTLTTDYTVTGVGAAGGGNVVLVNAAQAWLDGDGDLKSNYVLTIRRVRPLKQETDIRNQGEFFPETHEDEFDRGIMIDQQQQDQLDRSVRLPETIDAGDFDATLPTDIQDNDGAVIIVNATGDGFEMGPTADAIADAQADADAAAASAAASAASASAASTSASNALTSENNAEAAAIAAAASVASQLWQDVVFKVFGDSPIAVVDADRGKMFAVDCSGGNVVINLPAISGLTLSDPWAIGIKKTDSSGNTITVNRNGTDTIDGGTSKVIAAADSGAVFIPDTDPSPDEWTTAEFGASAGNMTVDRFSGTGAQTAFVLSVDPGSENNTWVYVAGVYQQKNVYSLSGTTLTFSAAPPSGTDNIEVISGTTLTIGTPSDATVTTAKIVDANVTTVKIADLNVTTAKIADLNVTTGKIADLGVTAGKLAANAVTYAKLGSEVQAMLGYRNRIINGDMRIDQVNEGAAVTVNNAAVFYSVDQFTAVGVLTSGVFTVQRTTTTPPTGFTHYIRVACTTADASIGATDRYFLSSLIEGSTIRDFLFGSANAKIFTLSFWVRSSLTGIYSGSFRNSATDRNYPFEYTISVADTWEQKTITLTADTTGTWLTTNGIGVNISFALAMGSNAAGTAGAWAAGSTNGSTNQVNWMSSSTSRTFDITGVQLELGSSATTFETLPEWEVLSRCQRYFFKTYDQGNVPGAVSTGGAVEYRVVVAGTAGANGAWVSFPVVMRASPAMTYFNPNVAGSTWRNQTDDANSGASGSQGGGTRGQFITNAQVAADGVGDRVDIQATADARL